MPSKSKKQARMMTAVCKSPKFRQKVGISKNVGCDFHKADKGKYHEEINTDIRDRNGVNEMSDNQLDEKLRFGKAKEEISTGGAPDIGRLMKMAGIQKQLDDDRENGKLDIRGILTGVAKGDIDISEADVRLQELAGITTKIAEISSKIQQHRLSLIQEIEQQIKERDTHLVEDADIWVCDMCDNDEVSSSDIKCSDCGAGESHLHRKKAIDEAKDEEIDEKKEWVKPWEKDKEADEDKKEVNESYWWNEGSNETERLCQLAGLKAKAFTEAADEEVDEAKDEEIDEKKEWVKPWEKDEKDEEVDEDKKDDLDEDAESYLANRDRVVKEKIAASNNKEEIDETDDDEELDEAIERKYFRELDTFKEGSLSRYMAEMIIDEMKKGKTTEEISEELSFDIDEVSYIVEFAKEKATEAKQVNSQWGNERASDKEDRLIARLDKKDTGDARNAKPKLRKRDKYDDLAAKHGLQDSARSRVH